MKTGDLRKSGSSRSVAAAHARPVNSQRRTVSEEELTRDPGLALEPLAVSLLEDSKVHVAIGPPGNGRRGRQLLWCQGLADRTNSKTCERDHGDNDHQP